MFRTKLPKEQLNRTTVLQEIERQSTYEILKNAMFEYPFDKSTLKSNVNASSQEAIDSINRLYHAHFDVLSFHSVINRFNVLRVDSALDFCITDTQVTKETVVKNFKLPYNAFFVDKGFAINDSEFILGFAVCDSVFISEWMLSHKDWMQSLLNRDEKCKDIDLEEMCTHIESDMTFFQDVDVFDRIVLSIYLMKMDYENDVHYISHLQVNFSALLKSLDPKLDSVLTEKFIGVEKDILKYVYNICFLMNFRVRKECSTPMQSDFRMTNYYPDGKAKRARDNRFSVIKVFGDTRKYVQQYNTQRRKYSENIDAVEVSGHYRHFYSERYRQELRDKAQGIWIMPYIRGADKELYQRIIKLQP